MLDSLQVPAVDLDELLVRFVLQSRWVRPSDNSIRPEAFVPHPLRELSVTRAREASPEELWAEGTRIAALGSRTLYGKAWIIAAACADQGLAVTAEPIPENPNHANISKWPADKPAQKMIALAIAQKARFVPSVPAL